jgi:hypothetical protein
MPYPSLDLISLGQQPDGRNTNILSVLVRIVGRLKMRYFTDSDIRNGEESNKRIFYVQICPVGWGGGDINVRLIFHSGKHGISLFYYDSIFNFIRFPYCL